ncbi:MAG: tryptophan--tRNA ligase [Kofleriaceae bacterium]
MKRVLTGIKPTGIPHIGNYLGAIKPALELAARPEVEGLFFIADAHALNTIHDGEELARLTREVAATWLAFGLDPERVLFYRQSAIPEIFELFWMLSPFTSKGWMNRAHAYKAKVADAERQGEADVDAQVDMGLYNYPVLMSADIVLFDTDVVPVGKDQVQHIEIARDIAQRVNHTYRRELLKLPVPQVGENTAIVPGLDGRKMSKSYDNTIPLFLPPKQLRKLVNQIVTDSTPPEAPKDPETSSIFQIYRLLATPEQTAALRDRYGRGIGWGEAKGQLAEVLEQLLAGPRAKYEALMANPSQIDEALAHGAERARELARPVIERVRRAIGFTR